MNKRHIDAQGTIGWRKSLACALLASAGLAVFTWTPTLSAQDPRAEGRPYARTQQEHDDFKSAYSTPAALALERAADDFAAKYPESDLRRLLYGKALRSYQVENNPAKMLAMADKVLALEPTNVPALVLSATVMADQLGANDRDRSRTASTIKRNVERAIENLDKYLAPPGATPDQAAVYKATLRAMAYSALGTMKLKTGDDAGAERDLKAATEQTTLQPDPSTWYHLALAQDHRKKYGAALTSVEQALQLSSADPELQKLAEAEHERLAALGRGAAPHNGPDGGTPR